MIEIPETRDLFVPHERVRVPSGWSIGRDLGADIQVRDDGRVVAVSARGDALVNSSAEQYAASLEIVGRLRDHLRDHPDDESSILRCAGALQDIDTSAYDAGEYWSLVIEQIVDEQF